MLHLPETSAVLVANPESKGFKRVASEVESVLQDRRWLRKTIYTPSANFWDSVDYVASAIKPGDILVVSGGDCTAGIAANAAVESGAEDITTIFLPAGRGNDISMSHFDGVDIIDKQRFVEHIAHGNRRMQSTILVELDKARKRHALGYVGIGATARISSIFCNPTYRKFRNSLRYFDDPIDGLSMLGSFLTDRSLEITEDGEARRLHEMLFMRSKRMAKTMRLDVDTFSTEMKVTEYGADHFLWNLAKRTCKEALRDGIRGEVVDERVFDVTTPTFIQLDGEAQRLARGTHAHISSHPNTIRVIAA